MPTEPTEPAEPAEPADPRAGSHPGRTGLLVAALVAAALAVRLVGIRHGLPMAYNPDEALHFVPQAVRAAEGDWETGYYQNPSGLTYLLAAVFAVVFPGDLAATFRADPTAVFTVARVVVALLGAALVPVVLWAGRRFFDRRSGLVAAAIVAFAFLPVHYGHQAVNDVVTLLPLTLALVGCLLVVERGDWTYLLAGGAVGLAGAVKYLAAPMALVVVLAAAIRVVRREEGATRALLLLVASGAACLLVLLAVNPYLLLDLDTALEQLTGQSTLAATSKLGQDGSAWAAYPASLLWGLGVVPVLLAVVGAVAGWRTHRAQVLLLVAFPVALYLAMATQDRFFARWMLPAYPAIAILAGHGAVRVADRWRARSPGSRRVTLLALPVVAAVALVQPVVDSVRNDIVLARTDTRTQALAWIHDHVDDDRIVVEPAVPDRYLAARSGFTRYPVSRPYQRYEESLAPSLLDTYRTDGFCWVMVNSHQRDRGVGGGLPDALAYYARLDEESTLEAAFSPYRDGWRAPRFSYDLSFNWWPLAYERPGPEIEVRRLVDCGT